MRKSRFLTSLAGWLSERVGTSFAFRLRTAFGLTRALYAGRGGDDASDGLTWGNRKLNISAAVDSARPGDWIIVGPR